MNKIAFERGRNDARMGLKANCPPIFQNDGYSRYAAGHEYQETKMKDGKYSEAFQDGQRCGNKGEAISSNPHKDGTTTWKAWNNGHIVGSYALMEKTEKEARKAVKN